MKMKHRNDVLHLQNPKTKLSDELKKVINEGFYFIKLII